MARKHQDEARDTSDRPEQQQVSVVKSKGPDCSSDGTAASYVRRHQNGGRSDMPVTWGPTHLHQAAYGQRAKHGQRHEDMGVDLGIG